MYAASRAWGFVGLDDEDETVDRVDRSEELAAGERAIGCGCEIEYDALAAFRTALEHLSDERDRIQVTNFLANHERHVHELTQDAHCALAAIGISKGSREIIHHSKRPFEALIELVVGRRSGRPGRPVRPYSQLPAGTLR